MSQQVHGVFGWKKMKVKEREGFGGTKNSCLDSKMGGKLFEGKGIERV